MRRIAGRVYNNRPDLSAAVAWRARQCPRRIITFVTSAEQRKQELHLHLFTVDDPRLWEFRSQLSDHEFAIPEVSNEEWDIFHAIIDEA